jgi:hypothetical protein
LWGTAEAASAVFSLRIAPSFTAGYTDDISPILTPHPNGCVRLEGALDVKFDASVP